MIVDALVQAQLSTKLTTFISSHRHLQGIPRSRSSLPLHFLLVVGAPLLLPETETFSSYLVHDRALFRLKH